MKISNKYLTASFKTKGAELCSLERDGREYIWQADPAHWNRHAPVLFPIVGKLKNNSYQYNSQSYEMGQHGFARDQEFNVKSHKPDEISFGLEASEDTLRRYPFPFQLMIIYRLKHSSLETSYEIKNTGENALLFSIGGHPAFNCPIAADEHRSDYWLSFDQHEEFITHRLTDGNFSGETELIGNGTKLKITDSLFNKDALVFKNLNSSKVSLSSVKQRWLTFHFAGFPYLGIWSKNEESPFVCIEPWHGLADYQNHNQKLIEKEGIRSLSASETFSCSYLVEVH